MTLRGAGSVTRALTRSLVVGLTLLWLLGLATIGIGLWWGPLESFSSLARLR